MAKNIKDYQLVEVYNQGVWNTVWQKKKKKVNHDPRAPKWARTFIEGLMETKKNS
jgi:hypothetical protein